MRTTINKTHFFNDLIINYNVELSSQFDHSKFIFNALVLIKFILNENRIKFRRITFTRRTLKAEKKYRTARMARLRYISNSL